MQTTFVGNQHANMAGFQVKREKAAYGAFLSYIQLKEYLATLRENGLLQYDAARIEYRTTPKE
jgi:predicted transcriptional regulator